MGATPLDQLWCRIQFRQSRYDGPFLPPSQQGNIAYPAFDGVVDWYGVTIDPVNRLLIAHSSYIPFRNQYLRAFDEASGKKVWERRLPAGGQATPMTYLGEDGRQYIVIAVGGHGGLRTRTGDYVVAYALPSNAARTEAATTPSARQGAYAANSAGAGRA